jgi:YD repeat-containing protein
MRTSNLALDSTASAGSSAVSAARSKKERTSAALRRRLASRVAKGGSIRAEPSTARAYAAAVSELPAPAEQPPAAPVQRWLARSGPAWDELLVDLGVEPECLRRNLVAHRECTLAGRFVDVATGKAIVTHRDFALGTHAPLVFDRVWLSTSTYSGPLGHGWHHAYDIALACRGDTIAIRFADGRVVEFAAPTRANESFDSIEQLRLARDSYGFVLRDQRGSELRFVPHRSQQASVLSSLRTLGGCELRFGYDHRGRLVRITSRGERDIELAYDRTDRVVAIRGADAQHAGKRIVLVQFAYDARGNLSMASDALGQARRYTYDRHLLTEAIDRSGCTSHFEWDGPDPRARCVHTWVDTGVRERKLEYSDDSTVVRNSLGHEMKFRHDGAVVQRIVDARGHVRELVRGVGRRVQREIDALGQVIEYEYEAGALTKRRGPDGAVWRFELDGAGRTLATVDPLGGRSQCVYDSRGRLVRSRDPLGNATRHHYRGRWLVGITRPGEQHAQYAYDDAGNLESYTAPGGTVASYAYDAWSQLVAKAGAHAEERSYDVIGRLVRVRAPDGNTCELSYDAEGRLVRWKDRFREMKFTYQGTGQLSSRTDAGATMCFEYDAEEQLVGIVNEHGKELRISRDETGAIIETTGFDGCKRGYVRDALGRVARVERAGQFSEYDYDACGRVIEVQHSDGAFEGYRYRPDGALVAAWNQDSTLTFERDACARVTREQQGDQQIVSEYDPAGRRIGLGSSLGANIVLERDAGGRLRRIVERVSGFELRYERDARGLIVARSLPDGSRYVFERDAGGRACAVRHEGVGGAVLLELRYEWDASGRLRRSADSQGGTADYRYDGRGNVAWRKAGDGRYELRMPDAVGNQSLREDRRDREYGASGQVLTRSGTTGEVLSRYDAAGQLIERREPGDRLWRYTWSSAGLLRCVLTPDGAEIGFGYDAFGRRIWKRSAGRTTRFFWDGDRMLHECVDGESPTTWIYDPDEGQPVAKLVGGDAFAVVADHTGAPSRILDRDRQPLWAAHTSITGALHVIEGARTACWLRWPGMYEDEETGLLYEYRRRGSSRYYDPAAGAYVDQGALAVAPGLRAYGHGYALGIEWTESRPVSASECHDGADAREKLIGGQRVAPLAPGGAYGPHAWSTVLSPTRDCVAWAHASDTAAFLSVPGAHRNAFEEPLAQLMESACELEPTQHGPLALPLLSR